MATIGTSPASLVPAGTQTWQIQLKLNDGITGWTERFWYALAGSNPTTILGVGKAIAALRNQAMILGSAGVVSVAVRPVLALGVAPVYGPALEFSLQAGLSGGAMVIPGTTTPALPAGSWNDLYIRANSVDWLAAKNFWVRGIAYGADAWTNTGIYAPNSALLAYLGPINAFIAAVSNGGVNGANPVATPGVGNGTFVIPGRDKTPSVLGANRILSVGIDPTGCYGLLTLDHAYSTIAAQGNVAYLPGQHIHIGKVSGCSCKKLNGDAVVITPPTLTQLAPYQMVVNRKCCCCGTNPLTLAAGQITNISPIWYVISNSQIVRATKHKTGRPNYSPKARGRASVCSSGSCR